MSPVLVGALLGSTVAYLKKIGKIPYTLEESLDIIMGRPIGDDVTWNNDVEVIGDVVEWKAPAPKQQKVKFPRAKADRIVKKVEKHLKPYVDKMMACGSYRRGAQMIGDIDFVIILKDGYSLPEILPSNQGVNWVGDQKAQVVIDGEKVDFRVTTPEAWGATILYFTGPADFNIKYRWMAKKRGLKLSEYGLFDRNTDKYIAGKTENDIFTAMGRPYRDPADRKGFQRSAKKKAEYQPNQSWEDYSHQDLMTSSVVTGDFTTDSLKYGFGPTALSADSDNQVIRFNGEMSEYADKNTDDSFTSMSNLAHISLPDYEESYYWTSADGNSRATVAYDEENGVILIPNFEVSLHMRGKKMAHKYLEELIDDAYLDGYSVQVIDVDNHAIGFWEKMQSQGLIEGWSKGSFAAENYVPKNEGVVAEAWIEGGELKGQTAVRIDYLETPIGSRGLGRSEFENILTWAKKHDVDYIIIESESEAVGFWKKMGFKKVGGDGELITMTYPIKNQFAAEERFYYHGTDARNLASILEEGIKPTGVEDSVWNEELEDVSPHPYYYEEVDDFLPSVFVAETPEEARWWAEEAGNTEIVVLKISSQVENLANFSDDGVGGWRTSETIPTNYIVDIISSETFGAEDNYEATYGLEQAKIRRRLKNKIKKQAIMGTKAGQWSARKSQELKRQYEAACEKRGLRAYKGKKTKSQDNLSKWSRQKWGTASGKKSSKTGEPYFPAKAIEALKDRGLYAKAKRQKQAATKAGKQHARYSDDIREVVKPFRAEEQYPICPLCHGYIPNDKKPGAYPGAMSRVFENMEICSACGTAEAVGPLFGPMQDIMEEAKEQGLSGLDLWAYTISNVKEYLPKELYGSESFEAEYEPIGIMEMDRYLRNRRFTTIDLVYRNRPVKEWVYERGLMGVPNHYVRVYTSINRYGRNQGQARDSGRDAIRVQVIYRDNKGETLVSAPKRVHRVGNWKNNLQKRLDVIAEELPKVMFDSRGEPMTLRKYKGNYFWGSRDYPAHKETRRYESESEIELSWQVVVVADPQDNKFYQAYQKVIEADNYNEIWEIVELVDDLNLATNKIADTKFNERRIIVTVYTPGVGLTAKDDYWCEEFDEMLETL